MSPHSLPSSTLRGLSLSGLVLVVLFLTIVSDSLLPLRLIDPAWQLRIGGALVNASPFALIGLGLVHLAAILDESDQLLFKRRQLAARLAVGVSLGYLLLAPLLCTALLRQQQSQRFELNTRLRHATTQLQQLRQVVNTATSVPRLEQQMAAMQGPKLNEVDRTLPLPQLRSRVNELLDEAMAQVSRAKTAATPADTWTLLNNVARTTVSSLALSVGFAGLAKPVGAQDSLLQELQGGLFRLHLRRRHNRRTQGGASNEMDYIRQLTMGDE